ncbi:MAG: hypothetical protein M1826_005148 [Phylliscum demangeonii]|nr:MAG: hypothetical protein M1826_005148 [Phylliscum demangeonii]
MPASASRAALASVARAALVPASTVAASAAHTGPGSADVSPSSAHLRALLPHRPFRWRHPHHDRPRLPSPWGGYGAEGVAGGEGTNLGGVLGGQQSA